MEDGTHVFTKSDEKCFGCGYIASRCDESDCDESDCEYNHTKRSEGDMTMLKYIIQDVVKNFKENPKMVSDITGYAEKIYEQLDDVESLNLYCSTLILNKDVDKAIKVVTAAKEKAEKNGQEVSNYDGLLNYLNSKKA